MDSVTKCTYFNRVKVTISYLYCTLKPQHQLVAIWLASYSVSTWHVDAHNIATMCITEQDYYIIGMTIAQFYMYVQLPIYVCSYMFKL